MSEPKSREGTQFGPYRLRRLIGKGGMGEVYEAEDTVKDRVVALKLLPEGMSHDPVFRKRLQREAHSAGRLQEPHVVPIHDYGEIDGVLYVDMRMISGSDLRKLLKSYGPMTPARAVAIIRQVASALDAAHESGIMHRDVKPENILVTREDFAYLVDFGIANAASDEKLTELGTAVGTYAYMAPERFQGDEVTFRADIYALACVLHECLTGSQPYGGDSVSVVITAHLMQPVPRPSVERPGIPAAFDQVIARGMAKKPDERFSSAGAMAMAATQALTESDKGHAETIVQRSEAATTPAVLDQGATMAAPTPTPPPGSPPSPPPGYAPAASITPPPGSTPPPLPYGGTPGSYPATPPPGAYPATPPPGSYPATPTPGGYAAPMPGSFPASQQYGLTGPPPPPPRAPGGRCGVDPAASSGLEPEGRQQGPVARHRGDCRRRRAGRRRHRNRDGVRRRRHQGPTTDVDLQDPDEDIDVEVSDVAHVRRSDPGEQPGFLRRQADGADPLGLSDQRVRGRQPSGNGFTRHHRLPKVRPAQRP